MKREYRRQQELTRAIDVLARELHDEELFYVWQSCIAMAFHDAACWHGFPLRKKHMHAVSNEAAINFLKLLRKDRK